MEKESKGIFAKLFGKKKECCCGVVVKEIDQQEGPQDQIAESQTKSCDKTAEAEK